MKLAGLYWSNPAVRLAKTNYKRRRRGLPEYPSVDHIPTQSEVAARIPRGRYERFAKADR
jgi:hypothetical protein